MKKEHQHYLTLLRNKMHEMHTQELQAQHWLDQLSTHFPQRCQEGKPPYLEGTDYCSKFWQLYLLNELIILKIKDLLAENKSDRKDIMAIEWNYGRQTRVNKEKTYKKKRRTADEIQSKIPCPYHGCKKSYSCEVALNLHIKNKHNGGNKTERERLAVLCLQERHLHCQEQRPQPAYCQHPIPSQLH